MPGSGFSAGAHPDYSSSVTSGSEVPAADLESGVRMKTIVNKTARPLRVPLPGGKMLHLGPKKTGQIADNAIEHAGLRKLVDAGDLEVRGEGDAGSVDGGVAPTETTRESAQGHGKSNAVRRGGQRGA